MRPHRPHLRDLLHTDVCPVFSMRRYTQQQQRQQGPIRCGGACTGHKPPAVCTSDIAQSGNWRMIVSPEDSPRPHFLFHAPLLRPCLWVKRNNPANSMLNESDSMKLIFLAVLAAAVAFSAAKPPERVQPGCNNGLGCNAKGGLF